MHEKLMARARQTASGIALSWEHTSLTWRELLAQAVGFAELLRQTDVRPGDLVAVWGNSAAFHVVSLLGCGIAETVQMPLNPRWPITFLSDVVSRASVLMTDGRLRWPKGTTPPTTVSWSGRPTGKPVDMDPLRSEAHENSVVAVNWSRGTVGAAPKACLLTHKMILANAASLAEVMELEPGHPVAHLIPGWQHPHELIGKGLVTGSSSLILDFPYPRTALSLLVRYGARWVVAAPRLMESILPFGNRVRSAFHDVDAVLLFGDYPRPQTLGRLETLAKVRIFNGWGSAETSGIALLGRVSAKNADNCGTPCPGYEASVQSKAGGKEGELLIRGDGVALRYLDKTPVVGPEGWFASGDLVRICKDNTLRVLGKPDEAVVRGGKRVPLSQIEAGIARVPGVGDVAAISCSVDDGQVTLFVEPAEDTVELPALSRKVRQVFGESEHPEVRFLFSLPRLPDGRVDRVSLAEGKTIDMSLESLDRAILDLLNRRAATIAARTTIDTRPLSEDEAVLRSVVGHNRGPLYDDSVEEIFRCIIDHCRRRRR
jgi:long-chain acyl-CoA synthetase